MLQKLLICWIKNKQTLFPHQKASINQNEVLARGPCLLLSVNQQDMKNDRSENQSGQDSIVRFPELLESDVEAKLSDQAHRSYVSKLIAYRQRVESHFRENYGITAYPIFDILLAVENSESSNVTVASIAAELELAPNILSRYVNIAAKHNLITLHGDASNPSVSLTKKGTLDLFAITSAISEIAFKLRPLDPARQ